MEKKTTNLPPQNTHDVLQKPCLKEQQQIREEMFRCLHDLKAPLRAIYGLCQLLQRKKSNRRETQRMHQLIMESVVKMNTFVDDMATQLNREERLYDAVVDLNTLFTSLQKTHSFLIEQNQCQFDFLTPNLPAVKGHPLDMERVLSNILDNALKHKRKTPLVLRITAQQEFPFIHLLIEDNGTGLQKSNLIGQASDAEHPEGWGKGLIMSYQILQKSGGTLTLMPSKKGGCCVKLTFLEAEIAE